ncbi:hypothetical protein KJ359_003234 [Pestalotiopsis sp. 9143b]|nr:hypothetical protein KJ359_003234 [Pestalotiopsis sp. 9143b]
MATAVDLSDGDIERLLQEAEARLSARQNGQDNKSLTAPATLVVEKQSDETAAAAVAPNTEESHPTKKDDLSLREPKLKLSNKAFAEKTKATAGAAWFNLPKTDLTPEMVRDLKLLKMRSTLDPKRFYKKDSRGAIPEFSQVGTVVAGPTEYFSARMTKKERKQNMLQEVMDTEASNKKFKSKYGEIQKAKTSGKKGHYKKMTQKRYGKK